MKIQKNNGPINNPCGTPLVISKVSDGRDNISLFKEPLIWMNNPAGSESFVKIRVVCSVGNNHAF